MSCEVPLLFREARTDGPTLALSWVNGAAGPVGGDRLQLSLRVEEGAAVRIRSTGAAMVHPGPSGAPSTFDIDITLAAGATLDWWPEPTVSVQRSRHRTSMLVTAHADASARVVESVVRGRHAEPAGRLALHQRVVIEGVPILDQELELADGPWSGPGAHGPARAVLSAVTLGEAFAPASRSIVTPEVVAAVFALDRRAMLATATADDLRAIDALDLLAARTSVAGSAAMV
ncbi:MAG: urease accessory protein UreD [Actinobacteria bacterium]|nr:urease accessory protein UreD [Actinomycetota bacterium]